MSITLNFEREAIAANLIAIGDFQIAIDFHHLVASGKIWGKL